MKPDAAIQQQALQKEFNDLVLKLSQQVSDKHLLDTNKNIAKVNSDMAHKLDSHVALLKEVVKNHPKSLENISNKYLSGLDNNLGKINDNIATKLDKHAIKLDDVSQKHADRLDEVSKNHRVEVNKSITKLNEHIPSQLDSQSLVLQSIGKDLYQYQNKTCNTIQNHSDNLAAINEQQLKTEITKVMQKMETSFAINVSEMNELKNHHRKGAKELQRDLDTKIESIKRAILYAVIAIIICIGSPLAFLIYTIVIR